MFCNFDLLFDVGKGLLRTRWPRCTEIFKCSSGLAGAPESLLANI